MKKRAPFILISLLMLVCIVNAQEPIHWQKISEIKAEGFNHSQVMELLSYLTDFHGPRLTGSPGLASAHDRFV